MKDKHNNKLIHETSPYLLQHAHNPVDWYPWGDEALTKAKKENKLLLISVGYSACHWCHVMEHESFEDAEVAKLMNDNFVCIKVDREERPDVDQVYMDAVQLMTGRGGWPLNCFALPDGRPVYGGTYFRKADWTSLLKQLATIYTNESEKLEAQAKAIQEGVLKQETAQVRDESSTFTEKDLNIALHKMAEGFDKREGGFNGAPKFPMPSVLNYMLSYTTNYSDNGISDQIFLTLNKIALGGIYDHIGGGFARYSVDEKWHVPHFEKMLYDNAQLTSVYSKAYKLTNNKHYKRVVSKTLEFIKRELTAANGAFYSALDADSEGEEGKFYIWTADELKYHLGEDYSLFAEYYSITENGNWEHDINVLKSKTSAEKFSVEKSIPLNDLLSKLEMAETKLLSERSEKVRPGLDDKILCSWNALMLKAYIDAYNAFRNETFLSSALLNANFLKENFLKEDGSLYRSHKNGISKINGFLDDYSFTIAAFIELYQITFDEEWMKRAKGMSDYVVQNFSDANSDFFFYTSVKDKPLAVRKKEISDNVIPSSNSSMAENLWILSRYYGDTFYSVKTFNMINSMAFEVKNYGRFYSNWGRILNQTIASPKEIVITGSNAEKLYSELKFKLPENSLVAIATTKSDLPIFQGRFVKNETLIYVCENNSCKLPVKTVSEAIALMTND